jgi:glycolate oxidase
MNETPKEKRGVYSDETAAALRSGTATPEFQTLHEIVKKARQNLDQNNWDYIVGGTES